MIFAPEAVTALAALGQPSRLAIFRLLVRSGPGGLAAGLIARELDTRPSTLSNHLAILADAGLIVSRRRGRSLIYAVAFEHMRALLSFLIADCCEGRPEICAGLAELAA